MSGLQLALLDSAGADRWPGVRQFIAADASGSFGILPGHAAMVAVLRYGLARFEDAAGSWRYLALPGGVLRIADNVLTVCAVRYFLGDQPQQLVDQLAAAMSRDDSELQAARQTLARIDRSLLRRLADMQDSHLGLGGG